MRRQQATVSQPEARPSRFLSPYDVMRLQNCKTYKFRKNEMYPSIRPPISNCNAVQTAVWLSNAMQSSGCRRIDPYLFGKLQVQEKAHVKKLTDSDAKSTDIKLRYPFKKVRAHRRNFDKNLDWSKLTPYDIIKLENCKTFKFRKGEMYPSIRPPISHCSRKQTAEWLADAVEDSGCSRYFDMEQDDVIEVWKQSPNKHTLSFYGVGTAIHQPEAVMFNQMISKCLNKATRKSEVQLPKPPELPKQPDVPIEKHIRTHPTGICEGLILNRDMLQSKICRMPTVQRVLQASQALSYLYCPRPRSMQPQYPFLEKQAKVTLEGALDMEKPVAIPKHGLRRKHKYCDLQCGIPENTCTDFEWRKYKQDSSQYDAAIQTELEQLQEKAETEPRNYDELYAEMIKCFKREELQNPLCKCYEKCCKHTHKDKEEDGTGGGQGGRPPGPRPDKPPKPHKPHKPSTGTSDGGDGGDGGDGDGGGDGTKPGKPDKPNKPGKQPGKKPGKPDSEDDGKKPKPPKGQDTDKVPADPNGSDADKKPPLKDVFSDEKFVPKSSKEIYTPTTDPDKDNATDEKPDKGKPDHKPGKHPPGKQPPSKKPPSHKPTVTKPPGTETIKDCPCPICEFSKRKEDTPFIRKMKQDEKRRLLREYYKRMCHREYLKWGKPNYRAPQHKCDRINCDNCFCRNPKLGEYCDCLDAMQQLQKLLGPKKHRIVENQLVFDVEDLRKRICQRFCNCCCDCL